jgi:hypothetical protein
MAKNNSLSGLVHAILSLKERIAPHGLFPHITCNITPVLKIFKWFVKRVPRLFRAFRNSRNPWMHKNVVLCLKVVYKRSTICSCFIPGIFAAFIKWLAFTGAAKIINSSYRAIWNIIAIREFSHTTLLK